MCRSGVWFCGKRLLRFFYGSLLDGRAVMNEPRTQKDGGESDSRDDAERKIIGFGQQGRPVQVGLNEFVTRLGGRASDRNGLGMDRGFGGGGRSRPRGCDLGVGQRS
jgi:hypothetical protein